MNAENRETPEKSPGKSRLATFATWVMNKVSPARPTKDN